MTLHHPAQLTRVPLPSGLWLSLQGPVPASPPPGSPPCLPAKTDYSFCAPSCYVWTIAATWSYLSPATCCLLLQTVVPFVGSTLSCHLPLRISALATWAPTLPSPGDLPNPGIETPISCIALGLLHCRRLLYQLSHQGRVNNAKGHSVSKNRKLSCIHFCHLPELLIAAKRTIKKV